jgi:hypothetical protein
MLKTVLPVVNALGALNYKGTWNASTNTPALTSGAGTKGDYYVVSVAGATTLDGISNWGIGDWAAFNGTAWQRVEGGADLNGVNLSVSGTSTLSGLTASTGLALDSSKNIVSVTNTGTGNNVLATSPTLTTPNIGDATGTRLDIDNVRIDGNTISSTNTNGDLTLAANGTGDVITQAGGATRMTITDTGNWQFWTNSDGGGTNVYQIGMAVATQTMNDANGSVVASIKAARFPGTAGGVTSGAGWVLTTGLNTYAPYGAFSDEPTINFSGYQTEFLRGNIKAVNVYSTIVGGTNRDLFIDNTGLIGYVSSTRASKTNIADINDVSWLNALKPVEFNRRKMVQDGEKIDDNGMPVMVYSEEFYEEKEYGLIADDAEFVNSELCFYDVVDGVKILKGIHYSKLIVPLLKRVQQLEAELATLKGA